MIQPVDDHRPEPSDVCHLVGTERHHSGQCERCGAWWSVRVWASSCPPCARDDPRWGRDAFSFSERADGRVGLSFNEQRQDNPRAARRILKDIEQRLKTVRARPGPAREYPLGNKLADARRLYEGDCRAAAMVRGVPPSPLSLEEWTDWRSYKDSSYLRERLMKDYAVTWREFQAGTHP